METQPAPLHAARTPEARASAERYESAARRVEQTLCPNAPTGEHFAIARAWVDSRPNPLAGAHYNISRWEQIARVAWRLGKEADALAERAAA